MRYLFINIVFICLFFTTRTFSQDRCAVPAPPLLNYANVDPETGKTTLRWNSSPSTGIAAYIVSTYINGDAMPLDTIWNPLAVSSTFPGNSYKSVSYVVTAYRLPLAAGQDGCPSPLSNALGTIFCNAVPDTCKSLISLSWNKYSDYPVKVNNYRVFESIDGVSLAEKYVVDKSTQSFNITDFLTGHEYCFAIMASLENGSFSSSGKACLKMSIPRPPAWINADFATVNDQKNIDLSFTSDPYSGLTNYILEKETGASGFSPAGRLTSSAGKISATDSEADISRINYYRLVAINKCNSRVAISDTVSNIVLSAELSDYFLTLKWNKYFNRQGSNASFRVMGDKGNGFEPIATLSNDTTVMIDYKSLMYDISKDMVCFYIEATELNNIHGIVGNSRSSEACLTPVENITVPDAFTPGNDLVNDTFKPVLSFTPSEYHLAITDRTGRKLFETDDYLEEWDGSGTSGNDVCLWFLRVKTPSGRAIQKTGTVTVISKQ